LDDPSFRASQHSASSAPAAPRGMTCKRLVEPGQGYYPKLRDSCRFHLIIQFACFALKIVNNVFYLGDICVFLMAPSYSGIAPLTDGFWCLKIEARNFSPTPTIQYHFCLLDIITRRQHSPIIPFRFTLKGFACSSLLSPAKEEKTLVLSIYIGNQTTASNPASQTPERISRRADASAFAPEDGRLETPKQGPHSPEQLPKTRQVAPFLVYRKIRVRPMTDWVCAWCIRYHLYPKSRFVTYNSSLFQCEIRLDIRSIDCCCRPSNGYSAMPFLVIKGYWRQRFLVLKAR